MVVHQHLGPEVGNQQPTRNDLIASDVLNLIALEYPQGSVKTHKKQNLKRSKFGLKSCKVFFESADALLRRNERSNMDTQVSELDFMDFSSVNELSFIVSQNQLASMLL
jgi:hypothetical protein